MGHSPDAYECDVLVVGSGAGGLSAAVTAGVEGLKVLVVEKDAKYGGTTATSGGAIWVAASPTAAKQGVKDTIADARTYLQACAEKYGRGEYDQRVDTYLANGPRMMEYMEARTRMEWMQVAFFPDYHAELPGAHDQARTVNPLQYDAQKLPADLRRKLKWPWLRITFAGIQVSTSGNEQHHFYHAASSPRSALYVAGLLVKQVRDLVLYGRSRRLVNGNGVIGRLAGTCYDLGIPIWVSSPAVELIASDGRITGAWVDREGVRTRVNTSKGVVLASGGFSYDKARVDKLYPHVRRGGRHYPIGTPGDTGDGARMAEAVGGVFSEDVSNPTAYAPATPVPERGGGSLNLPHQRTYGKPGAIAVTRKGVRFTNDALAYHDMVQAMIRACEGEKEVEAFVICDHPTLRKYGFGITVRPYPYPIFPHLRKGYLFKGRTLQELGRSAGIDPEALAATVANFNRGAREGIDPQFHRGETEFDRCQGDPEVKPNPSLAPIEKGPYYALLMVPGDTGSFAGLKTNDRAQVLGSSFDPIPGLYAVGNDMESIFGGDYPGGGITIGPAMVFGYIAALHMAGKPIAELTEAELAG